jgi:hypothetical protein
MVASIIASKDQVVLVRAMDQVEVLARQVVCLVVATV